MNRNRGEYVFLGLLVATASCIGTWLALPQIQKLINTPAHTAPTSIVQPTTAPAPRQATVQPLDDICPPTYGYGYAVSDSSFEPNMVISGPAALHPLQGSLELGKVLGLKSVARWGINIPTGQSVKIPSSITLSSGKTYTPEGFYEIYASDDDVSIVQQRWLKYCP